MTDDGKMSEDDRTNNVDMSLLERMWPVELPVPPGFDKLCGYEGAARWVAVYFGAGDEVYWNDGRSSATGNHWGYLTLMQHPVGMYTFRDYDFGSSDFPAKHWLLIDRQEQKFLAGEVKTVHEFLRSWMKDEPVVRLSSEEWERIKAHLNKAMMSVPMPSIADIQSMMDAEARGCEELRAWLEDYRARHFSKCATCGLAKPEKENCIFCASIAGFGAFIAGEDL